MQEQAATVVGHQEANDRIPSKPVRGPALSFGLLILLGAVGFFGRLGGLFATEPESADWTRSLTDDSLGLSKLMVVLVGLAFLKLHERAAALANELTPDTPEMEARALESRLDFYVGAGALFAIATSTIAGIVLGTTAATDIEFGLGTVGVVVVTLFVDVLAADLGRTSVAWSHRRSSQRRIVMNVRLRRCQDRWSASRPGWLSVAVQILAIPTLLILASFGLWRVVDDRGLDDVWIQGLGTLGAGLYLISVTLVVFVLVVTMLLRDATIWAVLLLALLLAYHAWWLAAIVPTLWQVDAWLALSWVVPTAWSIVLITSDLLHRPSGTSRHNIVRGFTGHWIRQSLGKDSSSVTCWQRAKARVDWGLGIDADNT